MILRIYTKHREDGSLVETGLQYSTIIYESPKILMGPYDEGILYTVFLGKDDQKVERGIINTRTHGYELINNAGVLVDKIETVCPDVQSIP